LSGARRVGFPIRQAGRGAAKFKGAPGITRRCDDERQISPPLKEIEREAIKSQPY
jgi:hypothetical protein